MRGRPCGGVFLVENTYAELVNYEFLQKLTTVKLKISISYIPVWGVKKTPCRPWGWQGVIEYKIVVILIL